MTVTAPPRPPRPSDPVDREEFEALVEALIEEARKRAQRRRRRNGAVVTLVALVGVALFALLGRSASSQTAFPALSARSSLPAGAANSKIAYTQSAAGGQGSGGLYVLNADGSGKQRLADAGHATPSWSPDGRKIAFGRGVRRCLSVVNADGSGQQRLTIGQPSCLVAGRAEDRLHARRHLRHQRRRQRGAKADKWRARAARPDLVARRPEDRLHESAAAVLPQLRHLRHQRRRQQTPALGTNVVGQRSCLVSRRAADRLRPRLRHLADERRRKRPAQAHERCGARSALRAGRQTGGRSPSIAVSEGRASSELRDLRHERRWQRPATARAGRRASLVARREEDRLFESRWQWGRVSMRPTTGRSSS